MDHFCEEIVQYVTSNGTCGNFEALALSSFERQYDMIQPYRRLCDSTTTVPGRVKSWRDIPPVPISAFKLFDLSCSDTASAIRIFHSSGTTSSDTSKHFMDAAALEMYKFSVVEGFRHYFGTPQLPIYALMESPQNAPTSSLSSMLELLGCSTFFGSDYTSAIDFLSHTDTPLILFATAFALMNLFDSSDTKHALPNGSIVIETGGFKGRSRTLDRSDFYDLISNKFRVSDTHVYSEYGMCELSSQYYSRGLDGSFSGPPWLKTRVVDPSTGLDCRNGQVGVVIHYDLTNVNSVLAIQTQDLGVCNSDGFTLCGRTSDAPLRGCSLMAE